MPKRLSPSETLQWLKIIGCIITKKKTADQLLFLKPHLTRQDICNDKISNKIKANSIIWKFDPAAIYMKKILYNYRLLRSTYLYYTYRGYCSSTWSGAFLWNPKISISHYQPVSGFFCKSRFRQNKSAINCILMTGYFYKVQYTFFFALISQKND